MKKLSDMMHDIDVHVDKGFGSVGKFAHKYFAVFSGTLLMLLMVIFLSRIFHSRSDVLTTVIMEDLASIEKIFNQIDKECNILSIRSDRAFIDFLTVEKFVGSTIGCLNLAYPKKWKGPYVKRNPTLQEKLYEIVRTQEGYFVLPGKGVYLPNKLVMGKDIIITSQTSIAGMLQKDGRLNFKNGALGFQLKFKIGDWDSPAKLGPGVIDKVNDMLKEFNETMPFAKGPDAGSLFDSKQI